MITINPEHSIRLCNTSKKIRSKRRSESEKNIFKPKIVLDYNDAKKGVDYSEQMSAYYCSLRKGLKWYRKRAFALIFGCAKVNSWIVYNQINFDKKISLLAFREMLAIQLSNRETATSTYPGTVPKRKHSHKKDEGPRRKRRRNCVNCYKLLRGTMKSKEAKKKESH